MTSIVDKYVDCYKGIKEYFEEESKILKQKSNLTLDQIQYKMPTENFMFGFENLFNPLMTIFQTYPQTIAILFKFKSEKINAKYSLIDFIITKIACLGYFSYQVENGKTWLLWKNKKNW